MIQHYYRLTLFGSGLCGRAVKNSNSGSGGPVFKPRPLRCFLRQARKFTTLYHPLHPGAGTNGYRRHAAAGDPCDGLAYHPREQ